MIIAIVCLLAGGLLGFFINIELDAVSSAYTALGILAAIDTIMGGIVSILNKTFDLKIFITGFFGNALLAVGILYLGTILGMDLYTGIVVMFIIRIFQNFAFIRRFLLNKSKKSVKIKEE